MGDDSDVEETPVTFQVKSSSDAKWSLTLDPSTTVADLKEKLAGSEYADVPAARQRLIYSGRVLKDGDTLATYNVKDGHTIHLVKSAQSNQPTQQRGPTPQASGTSTDRSATGQAPAGVPSNIAAGTGNNPLAGLTGARYAGFAQLPGAGLFGPDGGMGPPPDTEQMLNMLENPQFQSTMNEALQNPQLIDMMIQQNPMLRDMGPSVRQMLQSPMFRRMLTDPNMIRQMAQMQRAMGGGAMGGAGAGGNAAFPAPGVTNTTPQENQQQQDPAAQANQGGQGNQNPFGMFGMPGQGAAGQGAAANPFAALFGGFPPAPGGDTGNATDSANAAQPASDTTAQRSEAPQGTTTTTGDTTGGAGAAGTSNPQNPFAALFNPALFGNAGADANSNPQQTQNPPNPSGNPMNNPFLQDPALLNQMLQAMGGAGGAGGAGAAGGQNADAANNPLASLLGMGGMGGGQTQQDSRPPEERYAEQLSQLNDMGFFDFDRNVEALRRAGGNVQGAIEYLLGGP